jgi:glycosyltransferase involved in cell wall biosynthesis
VILTKELYDVIIPARDEEDTILSIVWKFVEHPAIHDIIVVIDPETTDLTASRIRSEFFKDSGVNLLYSTKPGKGQCVKQALSAVHTDVVILCDADLQGFTCDHVDRLTGSRGITETRLEQTILVPVFPENVPLHVINAWPWVSGQRRVPVWAIRELNLHGYLMEVQINNNMKRLGLGTRFLLDSTLISPLRMTAKRVIEMERDRKWGKEHGILE